MRILVINAGSSTLKWAEFDGVDSDRPRRAGAEEWATTSPALSSETIRRALAGASQIDAIGHRVVHGGTRFMQPTRLDDGVCAALGELAPLDPLHMRPALAAIEAARVAFPQTPQVAVFDTAFHATIADAAAGYALPFEWTERFGLRRFGFHGLSVQHSVARATALLGRLPAKMLVCHLGSGCSITAVADGRSIDTTMGFTPLDGVMMATRPGAVDPGLLLHLQARCGVTLEQLSETLQSGSGLLGVSGVSGDLRVVLAAAKAGSARARHAYEQFVWMLRRGVGAMLGSLGGVDCVVWTGGIGENSDVVRVAIAHALEFTGLRLASDPVYAAGRDRVLSAPDSRVAALVVHAREDLVIRDAVVGCLQPGTKE